MRRKTRRGGVAHGGQDEACCVCVCRARCDDGDRGGGFGSSNWDLTGSRTVSGGLVGGTVGYNYQFGQAVAGIEGDVDWSGINGSTSNNVCPFGL